jgi:acetyl-CoA carboxylase biotin carboxyl carrier protein
MINIEIVRELAEIMRQFNLSRVEARGDRIVLEKNMGGSADGFNIPAAYPAPSAAAFAAAPSASIDASIDAASPAGSPVDFNHLAEIRSPIVGVFYCAASPDSPPYVTIGSKIKKGDVLCIIEAMKLMNEVMAEQDGEVVDICVKNGDIAEYGQVLFKIKPSDGVL